MTLWLGLVITLKHGSTKAMNKWTCDTQNSLPYDVHGPVRAADPEHVSHAKLRKKRRPVTNAVTTVTPGSRRKCSKSPTAVSVAGLARSSRRSRSASRSAARSKSRNRKISKTYSGRSHGERKAAGADMQHTAGQHCKQSEMSSIHNLAQKASLKKLSKQRSDMTGYFPLRRSEGHDQQEEVQTTKETGKVT